MGKTFNQIDALMLCRSVLGQRLGPEYNVVSVTLNVDGNDRRSSKRSSRTSCTT
jgi:hypothetical protein